MPSISSGHLQFGIGTTASVFIEAQALFHQYAFAIDLNPPIPLNDANPPSPIGNNLSLIVTFTDTSGLLTEPGSLGFGLYDSGGGNFPVPGGLNGSVSSGVSGNATGNAQNWIGYVGQLSYTGINSQIITRPAQTGTGNNNQEAVTTGSSSSYSSPVTVGPASVSPSLTLTAGNTYTEVLSITVATPNSLAITNSLYAGASTNGTLLSQFGGIAINTTYLTSAFDAFAIGWRAQANTNASAIDISQVAIQSTVNLPASGLSPDPIPLNTQLTGNQLQVSWPETGWRLQIQTNDLGAGLGTNWVTVPNSTNLTSTSITINPTNSSVFLRLVYP